MPTIMELNRYALWVAKQTAQGTPATTAIKRLVQVGGDFNIARDQGSENFSDLTKWGNSSDWVNSVIGNGAPAIEAMPEELAYLLYLFHGGETTTAVTGPPAKTKHTFVPLAAAGFWSTFWKRLGQATVQREKYNDCRISQLVIEGSTANKAVRITPTVISLDAGEIFTVDPVLSLGTKQVLLYTDGTGTFTIDTVVFAGQSQFTLTLNEDLNPSYGDGVTPFALSQGNASATIGATVKVDANGLAQFNKQVYGTATPTAGTKPLKTIPARGSYGAYLKAKDSAGALNGDEFKITIPSVQWAVPDAPGPNPDGGDAEIALAGAIRNPGGGTPHYALDVSNDDSAYT